MPVRPKFTPMNTTTPKERDWHPRLRDFTRDVLRDLPLSVAAKIVERDGNSWARRAVKVGLSPLGQYRVPYLLAYWWPARLYRVSNEGTSRVAAVYPDPKTLKLVAAVYETDTTDEANYLGE